jgi:hypothetical protein
MLISIKPDNNIPRTDCETEVPKKLTRRFDPQAGVGLWDTLYSCYRMLAGNVLSFTASRTGNVNKTYLSLYLPLSFLRCN